MSPVLPYFLRRHRPCCLRHRLHRPSRRPSLHHPRLHLHLRLRPHLLLHHQQDCVPLLHRLDLRLRHPHRLRLCPPLARLRHPHRLRLCPPLARLHHRQSLRRQNMRASIQTRYAFSHDLI